MSDSAFALRVEDFGTSARLLYVARALALRKHSCLVARGLMYLEGMVAPLPEEESSQALIPLLSRLQAVLIPVAADEQRHSS